MSFGETLRAIRESRFMSQKELAEKAQVDPSHLSKIEKGSRMPSDEVLFRLADVLVAEHLFLAAGRLIPPEFKKKHPKPKFEDISYKFPSTIENLAISYHEKYCDALKKEQDYGDTVKYIERFISSFEDSFNSRKDTCQNKECEARVIINLCYKLRQKIWELAALAFEAGKASGKKNALIETCEEIRNIRDNNLKQYLIDFIELDENDAELLADLIQLRKNKQKPSDTN